MKVLIISDTHRRDDIFPQVLKKVGPIDLLVHAGDAEGNERLYPRLAGLPEGSFHYVAGNNDFFTQAPPDALFYIGPYRTYLTHGHKYRVSMGDEILREEAWAHSVNIVIYGHTHKPFAEYEGPMLVLNPGSLAFPRQEGRRPSYIVLEVEETGKLQYEIQYL